MRRALVENGTVDPIRTNTALFVPRSDLSTVWNTAFGVGIASCEHQQLIARIENRISKACKFPLVNGEPSQILQYETNQEYKLHVDAFDSDCRAELENGGNRSATFLVYLSTVPEACGGSTIFPRASPSLRVQPIEGRAVLWFNVRKDGKTDHKSEHASEPIIQHESTNYSKWALSKWLREDEFEIDQDGWSEFLAIEREW
jgi:prolyl 4-hydroxylase